MAELRQQPATLDLYIYQGDSLDVRFEVKDAAGTPVDVSTWTIEGSIKPSPEDPGAPTALTIVKGGAAEPSVFRATLTAAASRAITRAAVYDIQLTNPAGFVRTYVAGKIQSTAEVTQ